MSFFNKYSYQSRSKKIKLFYDFFEPTDAAKILDVGGEIDPVGEKNLQLIDNYKWKKNISAINISGEHIAKIKKYYPEINSVVGDACNLPWPDKYFDIAYSNAVIEHVGNFEKQKKMASEIMRVSKNWFVTTPNRFYPFEFHMRLPFVTWLPGSLYLWFAALIQYDHDKKNYRFFSNKYNNLRLMTASKLRKCFPDSRIIKNKITFWPETLIAIGGEIDKSRFK